MDAFDLIIDNKRMYAVLRATNKLTDGISDIKTLMYFMKKHSICAGIKKSVILKAFSELEKLEEERNYIIAKGKLPRHGEDGKVEFNIDVSGKSTFKLASDEISGKIDYKQAMCISEVDVGDIIGCIVPPTQGENGYNILGTVLKPKCGKAEKVSFGDGTELDQDGVTIIATQKGRPIFTNKTLTVTEYYEVTGDVCYETGNISFDGHVCIRGNVLDGFSVNAKSIEICGNIGNSSIQSSGDILVRGGINGHHFGNIECHGNAEIKYVNNANMIVYKDLKVEKGLVNSTVKCLGMINAQKIRGGIITAYKGIVSHTVGSPTGSPTFIESGINYKIKEINELQMELDLRIKTILSQLGDNLGSRKYFNRIASTAQNKIRNVFLEFKRIRRAYLKTLSSKIIMSQNERMIPVSIVLISKKLYSDVTVTTSRCFKHFTSELTGPIKLSDDYKSQSISAESCNISFNDKHIAKYFNDYCENSNSCFLGDVGAYTKEELAQIERQFNIMIGEQEVYACLIESDLVKNAIIKNKLKNMGIAHIVTVEKLSDVKFAIFEYSDKNIVFICRAEDKALDVIELLSELVKESMYYYGIVFSKNKILNSKDYKEEENNLVIINEEISEKLISKQLNNFGIVV